MFWIRNSVGDPGICVLTSLCVILLYKFENPCSWGILEKKKRKIQITYPYIWQLQITLAESRWKSQWFSTLAAPWNPRRSFESSWCLSPTLRNSGFMGLGSAWAFGFRNEGLKEEWRIEWMVSKAASVLLRTKLYSGEKARQALKGRRRINGTEARPWVLCEHQWSLE